MVEIVSCGSILYALLLICVTDGRLDELNIQADSVSTQVVFTCSREILVLVVDFLYCKCRTAFEKIY